MRARTNVATANCMAMARRPTTPSEHTSRVYRRLIIETALTCGYHLRLEHRSRARWSVIWIVHPVDFQAGAHTGGGLLTAQLIRQNHRVSFVMNDIDAVSLAIEHLPSDRTVRLGLTVGDAVRHDELGFGVVQSFSGEPRAAQADVLFALHGRRSVSDPGASLTRLDSDALARRAARSAHTGSA